jgi:hypothetical protein
MKHFTRLACPAAGSREDEETVAALVAPKTTQVARLGTWLSLGARSCSSGRSLRMTGATVYSFDGDNRISGQWQVVDRLGVFQLLCNAET